MNVLRVVISHTPERLSKDGPIDGCACGGLSLGASWSTHLLAEMQRAGFELVPAGDHAALVGENRRLRAALVGHIFDGESMNTREAIRHEMLEQYFRLLKRMETACAMAEQMSREEYAALDTDVLRAFLADRDD